MSTLIEVHTAGGTVRRCDAICHGAKGKTCGCVCGGKFHGIGTEAAAAVPAEEVDAARRGIVLDGGEYVQLRIGA